jgi:hypothetical protein
MKLFSPSRAVQREDVLPELGMSVADTAERLGISWQILAWGRRPIRSVSASVCAASVSIPERI